MNKIGILDIIEALSTGQGFNSIAVPDFHPEYNDYYVNRSYAVFEVRTEHCPHTLLVLLDSNNPASRSLTRTVHVINEQNKLIPFSPCRYLPDEFQPWDRPEIKCDVILIRHEEGAPIHAVVKPGNESLALLARIGDILHRMEISNIIIDGLFEHMLVSSSGTVKIQVSDRLRAEYRNRCSPFQLASFARETAFYLFYLWCKALNVDIEAEDLEFARHILEQHNDFQRLFDRMTRYGNKITAIYDIDLGAFAQTVLTGNMENAKELIRLLQEKTRQVYTNSCKLHPETDKRQKKNGAIDYLNSDRYTLSLVHNEDRIAIMQNDTGLWGYIDYYGTIIIDFKYHAANDFYDGYAIVMQDEKIGVINRFGEQIVPMEFDDVEWIGFDQIFRVIRNKESMLLNKNGQRISANYKHIGPFMDGLAMVETQEHRMGFISNQGKVVIPPRYLNITAFSNGIAMALGEDGIWYRISRLGQVLD